MSENPYQSPSAPPPTPDSKPVDTVAIVRYRRIIMVCVVILVPYYLLLLVMGEPSYAVSGPIARAAFIFYTSTVGLACIALLVACFSTALLGTKLHGPIAGILLGLVAFFPVVGLLTMAWVLWRSGRMLANTEASWRVRKTSRGLDASSSGGPEASVDGLE